MLVLLNVIKAFIQNFQAGLNFPSVLNFSLQLLIKYSYEVTTFSYEHMADGFRFRQNA